MEKTLSKKYGLPMAISMVIGIVIGSGVFFKAEAVLKATGGDVKTGIWAWLIVGLIMIICSYAFANLATKYEKVNGVVDYAEATLGKRYGYYIGWYLTVVYQPAITSVLAWVSARYTCVLLGIDDIVGGTCMTIAGLYLIAIYAMNALSPILAGKFQVSTTVIKLIPLVLMAIVGTIKGLMTGVTVENFTRVTSEVAAGGGGLFASIVAVAFAYEGWIIATSINAELKDAKKNLPKALVIGALIVVAVYIFYYIGLAGAVSTEEIMADGHAGAANAFKNVFGTALGSLIFVFVIVSCLGTLNGLMVGTTRAAFALASRNEGPRPVTFKQVDQITDMPSNSSVLGLFMCALWLLYFYGCTLMGWIGDFGFDSSELPIVFLYTCYIPMFIAVMIKEKDFSPFKRFVVPLAAIISCGFMTYAGFIHPVISASGDREPWKGILLFFLVLLFVIASGALIKFKGEKRLAAESK
ncbi:MAG TPA: APC family permease [Clostridiales bacterium]|nr:APC family permease [Clostridiales bacterium]